MEKSVLIVLILSLSGCVTYREVNRVNPQANYNQDYSQCSMLATQAVPDIPTPQNPSYTTNCRKAFNNSYTCESTPGQDYSQFFEGNRLMQLNIDRRNYRRNCMGAKGWTAERSN